MITSAADERIQEVSTTDDELIVSFVDGRTLSVPLVWYPRLFHASPEQRSDWQLIGDGDGVHWPQIDEDLSAAGMLRGVPAPAHRELAKPERSDAQVGRVRMPKRTNPWHSTESEVYHNNTECNTGNNIEREYRRPGTGGKRLCQECARLNGQSR